MSKVKSPEFNAALGARIRHARVAAGLSQGALGERLGISFQQVQKYELGKDRVSVEALVRTAEALGVAAARLIEGDPAIVPLDTWAIRRRLQIADALSALAPEVQQRVLALVDVLPREIAAQPSASEPVREAA